MEMPIRGKDREKLYTSRMSLRCLNTIKFLEIVFITIRLPISQSEKDILKLVTVIMANTKGDGEKENRGFLVQSRDAFCTQH